MFCRYLLISVTAGCEPTNQLWYCDIQTLQRNATTGALDLRKFDQAKGKEAEALPISKLVDNFQAAYDYVANEVTLGIPPPSCVLEAFCTFPESKYTTRSHKNCVSLRSGSMKFHAQEKIGAM